MGTQYIRTISVIRWW